MLWIQRGSKSKDHPRVCGEQLRTRISFSTFIGSPPRVRGTGGEISTKVVTGRITPACAGNSAPAGPCGPVSPDHPRVCGEQWGIRRGMAMLYGSPPRVRGTALPPEVVAKRGRITPACAGNRSAAPYGWQLHRDHPRVCGEQYLRYCDSISL